jgi:hypothetical protein
MLIGGMEGLICKIMISEIFVIRVPSSSCIHLKELNHYFQAHSFHVHVYTLGVIAIGFAYYSILTYVF